MSERAPDTTPSLFDRLPWLRRPIAGPPSLTGQGDGGTVAGAEDGPPSMLVARLDAIERALADVARRLPLAATDGEQTPAGTGDVAHALASLEKSVGRAGREQFKALALAEAGQEQLTAALEALRVADDRREAKLAAVPARIRDARDAARLDVAQSLFPALDGLDEAIRSGRRLLDQPAAPSPPPSFLDRLVARPRDEPSPGETALRESMEAWLTGLTFVRRRLLDVLAAEDVQPIAAEGQPFDPHYHVAAEVAPPDGARPPGTVAAEVRRGYVAGGRVLRYAEVAVVSDKGAQP